MKVFLDFDGPLLDNRPKYAWLHQDCLEKLGVTPLGAEPYWAGKRDRVPESEILARAMASPEQIASYQRERLERIEAYETLAHDRVWPGVIPWLMARREEGHELILVTLRKSRPALLWQLRRLQLLPLLHQVLNEEANDGSWQVKQRLISPRLGEGERGVMIGDTEADLRAARACGLYAVAVTCGIRTAERLAHEHPDHIVDSLVDVRLDGISLETGRDDHEPARTR